MRYSLLKVFLLMLNMLVIFVLSSCHDTNVTKSEAEAILNDPVYIAWVDKPEELESYRADVDVFAMQNDGLVALESQYYPKSMHDNVLMGNEEGYEGFPKLNHKNIIDDSEVKKTIQKMADLAVEQRKRL